MVIIIKDEDFEKAVISLAKILSGDGREKNNNPDVNHNDNYKGCAATKQRAIQLLKEGKSTEEVARLTNLCVPTVRAYKAHITMGTY